MAVSGQRTLAAPGLAVLALCVWTLAVTVSRALRWPNDFAEAHWLLDYRFGFVKRGLVGEVLTRILGVFGAEPTEGIIAGLSALAFVALCGLLLWLGFRIIKASGGSSTAALVVLAGLSSPFVVMSSHLVGYFDNLLVMLSVAAVALVLRGRLWSAVLVQSIAVLVHESAVVFGYPLLWLAWWRSWADVGTSRPLARAWPLLGPAVVFLIVAASVRLLAPEFQDDYSRRLAEFAFVAGDMHLLVPEWLAPGLTDQLATHRFARRIAFAEAYGLMLPSVFALLAYTVDAYNVRVRSVTMPMILVVVFAPQIMHLAAWDTIRIWTYSIAAAFLVAWLFASARAQPRPVSTAVAWLASAAILVNVMTMTPLLDELADRYGLVTRLGLYAPLLVGTGWLLWRREDEPG